jgi:NADPH-dependent ferric siderophore reductase
LVRRVTLQSPRLKFMEHKQNSKDSVKLLLRETGCAAGSPPDKAQSSS